MPSGSFNPVTSAALMVAPVVALYLPITPVVEVTNRFDPDTAISVAPASHDTSAAFIVAPVVALYSPNVPVPLFTTNRFGPDTARPAGKLSPVTSPASTVAPAVVYSPTDWGWLPKF